MYRRGEIQYRQRLGSQERISIHGRPARGHSSSMGAMQNYFGTSEMGLAMTWSYPTMDRRQRELERGATRTLVEQSEVIKADNHARVRGAMLRSASMEHMPWHHSPVWTDRPTRIGRATPLSSAEQLRLELVPVAREPSAAVVASESRPKGVRKVKSWVSGILGRRSKSTKDSSPALSSEELSPEASGSSQGQLEAGQADTQRTPSISSSRRRRELYPILEDTSEDLEELEECGGLRVTNPDDSLTGDGDLEDRCSVSGTSTATSTAATTRRSFSLTGAGSICDTLDFDNSTIQSSSTRERAIPHVTQVVNRFALNSDSETTSIAQTSHSDAATFYTAYDGEDPVNTSAQRQYSHQMTRQYRNLLATLEEEDRHYTWMRQAQTEEKGKRESADCAEPRTGYFPYVPPQSRQRYVNQRNKSKTSRHTSTS